MINFQKKTAAFAFLWICAALFLSAYEMSFDIPGKGTITRDVELQRIEKYDKNDENKLPDNFMAGEGCRSHSAASRTFQHSWIFR